jgi:xylose isomerase
MHTWKYSLILPFLGRLNDRFSSYGQARDLAQRFEIAAQVQGLRGLELVYPFEFADVNETARLLAKYNLQISSVNVNLKAEEKFHLGALTHRDPGLRREGVAYMQRAMDLATHVGAHLITMCPLADGFDYPFQSDYTQTWRWFLDGIGAAAAYRDDVRVSIEYKISEPRNHVILPNVGAALAACSQIGMANVGVTIDLGHANIAHESPAQSIVMLAQAGRLFLVHVNDNYREWDWDMIPGSVNWWDLVETMFYLKHLNYDGWLVSDVAPFRLDPVKVCSQTYRNLVWAEQIVERVGTDRLWQLIRAGDPIDVMQAMQNALSS